MVCLHIAGSSGVVHLVNHFQSTAGFTLFVRGGDQESAILYLYGKLNAAVEIIMADYVGADTLPATEGRIIFRCAKNNSGGGFGSRFSFDLPNAGANATKIFCQDPAPHGGLKNREFELLKFTGNVSH